MLYKAKQYLHSLPEIHHPLLLALSGGPDSMAAFHLLLESGLRFEVVHVDHKWRPSSTEEAAVLNKLVSSLGIPFHLKELGPISPNQSNLEEYFRVQRYQSISEVYVRVAAEGLILGHNKDEQVETILKRLLEGSGLSKLAAMRPFSFREGMRLHRPLLFHEKSEILNYLSENGIDFILDSTNRDTKYLRARMREELLPYIEEAFGKGIRNNLSILGDRAFELREYLSNQISPLLKQVIKGPLGSLMKPPFPVELVELEFLIGHLVEQHGPALSRDEMDRVTTIISDKKFGKGLSKGGLNIYFDSNGLFLHTSNCKTVDGNEDQIVFGWEEYWKTGALPSNSGEGTSLCRPTGDERLPNGVRLKRWYENKKVPQFMRNWPAIVYADNEIMGELLTGYNWSLDKCSFDLNR